MTLDPKQNTVAAICLLLATGLMVYLFAASRTDPSLRIAALVAGTGLVASLGSIASTLLTGKDVTKPEPPPTGGTVETTQSTKINVPPTPPPPAPEASNPPSS